MKITILAACLTAASVWTATAAQNAIVSIGNPIRSAEQITASEHYLLQNIGRKGYVYEDAYGDLLLGSAPEKGTDAGRNYAVSITPDGNGLFTVSTRRGRYIPEVGNGAVLSVGSEANAGHFNITPAADGHFIITNSVNTAYGFDGSVEAFVGWEAGEGSNCFYDIIPVTLGAGNYPLDDYKEPSGGKVVDAESWQALDEAEVYLTWASKDESYERRQVPAVRVQADTLVYAWRGERAGVKALAFSAAAAGPLSVSLGDWRDAKGAVVASAPEGSASWMRYVITDGFGRCGAHDFSLPTWTVADVIDLPGRPAELQARSVRPVWCTIEVPRNLAAGDYTTTLTVTDVASAAEVGRLELTVRVVDRTLPQVADQRFHLDMWQQPYAVARYHGVDRWSNEHFEALRSYMQLLGRAGQKAVSAELFHEPWGDQSHDKFDPMVETVRKADGTWAFDYTIFDRWVEFMEQCGISERINCYSMIPWDMSFRYVDEATDTYRFLRTNTWAEEYRDLWTAFLTDFAAHLRQKGWFEKTYIAMDERGVSDMLNAAKLLKAVVPDMKLALAGNYHAELVDLIDDYCLAYDQRFSADELARRREAGRVSTVYTCCTEAKPNLFTNSLPSEAAYLPLQAYASGTDGYLHWSLINWPEQPLTDSRFRLFAAGDTYLIYPGVRSSVRFERVIEGIQQAEKANVLRTALAEEGDFETLQALEEALAEFVDRKFTYYKSAASMVARVTAVANGAPLSADAEVTDYCPVKLEDRNADAAIANRWLKSASTTGCETNLKYTAEGPSESGAVTTEAIAVRPGSTFRLRLCATTNNDDMRYCRVVIAADWNRDFFFNPLHDEILFRDGAAAAENKKVLDESVTVSVPADAKPGMSLLRVCYSDAWGMEPDPCGELYKGFALDVPMEIIDPESSIDAVEADSRVSWTDCTLGSVEPVGVAVYSMTGALLHRAAGVHAYSLCDFTPGVYNVIVSLPDGRTESFKRRVR